VRAVLARAVFCADRKAMRAYARVCRVAETKRTAAACNAADNRPGAWSLSVACLSAYLFQLCVTDYLKMLIVVELGDEL